MLTYQTMVIARAIRLPYVPMRMTDTMSPRLLPGASVEDRLNVLVNELACGGIAEGGLVVPRNVHHLQPPVQHWKTRNRRVNPFSSLFLCVIPACIDHETRPGAREADKAQERLHALD